MMADNVVGSTHDCALRELVRVRSSEVVFATIAKGDLCGMTQDVSVPLATWKGWDIEMKFGPAASSRYHPADTLTEGHIQLPCEGSSPNATGKETMSLFNCVDTEREGSIVEDTSSTTS